MVSRFQHQSTMEADVPRDFDAQKPCPYDASAATIAARGMQMLYQLLHPTDKTAAEHYLKSANKLIEDTLRECGTPAARLSGGMVDFGEDGWETILAVDWAPVDGMRAWLIWIAFDDQWEY